MATNGSNTRAMYRLYNILIGEDVFNEHGYFNRDPIIIKTPDQLCVELSLDEYHSKIDSRVSELWRKQCERHEHSRGFGVRDVTATLSGVSNSGRAKKNGLSYSNHCVCSDLVIIPNGKIKLCGCEEAPIIGDVFSGIREDWSLFIEENEEYLDNNCIRKINKTVLRGLSNDRRRLSDNSKSHHKMGRIHTKSKSYCQQPA